MSDYIHLECVCGEVSDSINHGEDVLRKFAESAKLAHDITNGPLAEYVSWNEVIVYFVGKHFAHGGFWLTSEYWQKDNPSRAGYLREYVKPLCEGYAAITLADSIKSASLVRDQLSDKLDLAKREMRRLIAANDTSDVVSRSMENGGGR